MAKTQEFQVPHPKDRTFDALVSSLPAIKMTIKAVDPASGHIDASTGVSWKSWGERIRIDVSEQGDGSVVRVSSGNKAQLISWGKNDSNLQDIQNALYQALGPGPTS
ncbi:MAG: hypothetical protein M3198_11995 [Actinomycetota bacterium]|nr:hypothetical protein [Actinomycetota bacterium]